MHVGFVAQELLAAGFDDAVHTGADGFYSVDTQPLLAAAVNAINEQRVTIAAQSERIAKLDEQLGEQRETIAAQDERIAEQSKRIAEQSERIAALGQQLGKLAQVVEERLGSVRKE